MALFTRFLFIFILALAVGLSGVKIAALAIESLDGDCCNVLGISPSMRFVNVSDQSHMVSVLTPFVCKCTVACKDFDDEDVDDDDREHDETRKRDSSGLDKPWDDDDISPNATFSAKFAQGKARKFELNLQYPNGDTFVGEISSRAYPARKNFDPDGHGYWWRDYENCKNWHVRTEDWKYMYRQKWNPQIEHIVELSTIKAFLEAVAKGKLTSGPRFYNAAQLPYRFVMDIDKKLDTITKPCPGLDAKTVQRPAQRIFQALGSTTNAHVLVMYAGYLNGLKSRIWRRWGRPLALYEAGFMKKIICPCYGDHNKAFEVFRNVFGVFSYLNHKDIQGHWKLEVQAVKRELHIIEDAWNSKYPDQFLGLSKPWTEWIDDLLRTIEINARNWLEEWIDAMEAQWRAYQINHPNWNAQTVRDVLAHLRMLKLYTDTIQINTSNIWAEYE